MAVDTTEAVALGDADGDGDLDAFIGNARGQQREQQNRFYRNLTRQLAWRGVPRVAKPLTLDLFGTPAWPWHLFAATGTGNVPLPPFGTLLLDPGRLFAIASGGLDPRGRASLTFGIPNDPTLVGLDLYWQALIGSPLRFANLEVTRITGL